MNKDDFDIFRHLTKTPRNNSAVDLIRGLQGRESGHSKKHGKTKENVQLFAEEQLVRKQDLNEMRCEMPGLPRSTFLMVFSPDGQRAASTHGNHNIYVTDLRSGKNIKTLVGHPRTPWCIAFHPTSDQIVASGCLGGQVRIWDLSGGSEVWTTTTQSVIASIAFHPNDRVLVIATFNEVYFWDWSQPEPFVHAATSNPKEKVRYVAFDKLGHKLITGIANSPQTRWERVRAPVPVPRQERCASPYRRRITQRLVSSAGNLPNAQSSFTPDPPPQEREPSSVVPERERRITMCYRNLVREYELLVHRYLQLYRPPTMIDRGTDPMEPSHYTSGTQTAENSSNNNAAIPGPSGIRSRTGISNNNNSSSSTPGPSNIVSSSQTAAGSSSSSNQPQPSTSTSHSQNLITPSRIFSVGRKPPSSIRGTQTSETRKHKADELSRNNEKRFKRNDSGNPSSESSSSRESSPQGQNRGPNRSSEGNSSNPVDDQRVLVVNLERLSPERLPSSSFDNHHLDESSNLPRYRPGRFKRRVVINDVGLNEGLLPSPRLNDDLAERNGQSSSGNRYSERFNEYIRSNRERIAEFRRRSQNILSTEGSSDMTSHDNQDDDDLPPPTLGLDSERLELPISIDREQRSEVSSTTNPGHQRNVEELLSNIRRTAEEEVRNRILPIIRSVPPPDRPELIRLFENSREHVRMRFRQMCPVFLRRHCRRTLRIDSSTDSSSSDNEHDHSSSSPTRLARRNSEPNGSQQGNDVPSSSGTADTAASSNASTSTPNVSMTSAQPRTTERNFNTELEQLVTSLLTEIERNENEGNSSNNFSQTAGNSGNNTSATNNSLFGNTTSARTRPSRGHPWSNNERIPPPPGESIENMFYDDYYREPVRDEHLYRRFQADFDAANPTPPDVPPSVPSSDPRNSYLNTSTRTTNSTIYTSNSNPSQRRRFFSHRVSAFMPTRVNYTRTRFRRNPHYTWGSGRAGIPRTYRTPSLVLDELINYAERENSEDEPPLHFHPFDPPPEFPSINPENIGIGNMYSNIVQDLESSLNDVRNIRASNRPGETSDMLSSFSERLENIMNQSDTILRNLRSSMDLLPSATEAGRVPDSEPRWNFNDPGFYVRDLRNEPSNSSETGPNNDSSLQDLIGSLHAVATDHTYPRNPNSSTTNDNMSPLMNSLHLTISHIQRQARLLRRQVESIERIDRAMVEVAQLQLMRQLVIELVRHIRSLSGESRSTGVSSVRQMMAGTRISDSSPYESPNEEASAAGSRSGQQGGNETQPQPGTSLGISSSSDQPNANGTTSAQQRRSTNRKTYPPSRFVRLARHYQRRPSIVHWFSRRYFNRFERGIRQNQQARSGGIRTTAGTAASNVGSQIFNYSNINSSTLSLMTRRLEHLLTDQMRIFTRPQEASAPPRSTASVDLGEHILALRLHGCLLRMNRVLGSAIESNTLRNLRSDASAAVTQDGAPRYGARHTLSLIVDGMSRHIEELGTSNISNSMRMQIHGVLAMSLLLTELLLLQVVDSIPPPSGMNLDPERESLARRIDEMCTQMLQNRVTGGSAQLTRSLRLMRLTMRHAHRALDQTYIARRNAMLPRQDTDRRQLLGTINRCLRTISRTQGRTAPVNTPGQVGPTETATNSRPSTSIGPNEHTEAWYTTINELITRYSDVREDDLHNQPSTSSSRDRAQNRDALSSNNDNSDDDPDDWFYHRNNNTSSHNSNLYRTNNVNLVQPTEPPNPPRPWNVPSVQVNDIPVSEPSVFAQRLLSHRQRFAERVSELRSNPRVGLFRPRFLHPLYASVNPFDADLDDPQREQIYDSDMITTVTPNHRIQAWDISNWTVPSISNSMKNVVVSECKIHNDASVDIATDGTILVTLLPSGGYLNVTNRLGVYSLRWETLGQCLYTTSFEQNAVSVSLSPLSRHLVVGFASRRVSIVPSDRWVMARIYKIEQKDVPGDRLPVLRELEQHRESRINCIRWLPMSGQGLIYATNTGQLVILS